MSEKTAQTFEVEDVVNVTFREAVVTAVFPDGSIEVQNAGPRFRVHPDDNDTEIDKQWSPKP